MSEEASDVVPKQLNIDQAIQIVVNLHKVGIIPTLKRLTKKY